MEWQGVKLHTYRYRCDHSNIRRAWRSDDKLVKRELLSMSECTFPHDVLTLLNDQDLETYMITRHDSFSNELLNARASLDNLVHFIDKYPHYNMSEHLHRLYAVALARGHRDIDIIRSIKHTDVRRRTLMLMLKNSIGDVRVEDVITHVNDEDLTYLLQHLRHDVTEYMRRTHLGLDLIAAVALYNRDMIRSRVTLVSAQSVPDGSAEFLQAHRPDVVVSAIIDMIQHNKQDVVEVASDLLINTTREVHLFGHMKSARLLRNLVRTGTLLTNIVLVNALSTHDIDWYLQAYEIVSSQNNYIVEAAGLINVDHMPHEDVLRLPGHYVSPHLVSPVLDIVAEHQNYIFDVRYVLQLRLEDYMRLCDIFNTDLVMPVIATGPSMKLSNKWTLRANVMRQEIMYETEVIDLPVHDVVTDTLKHIAHLDADGLMITLLNIGYYNCARYILAHYRLSIDTSLITHNRHHALTLISN